MLLLLPLFPTPVFAPARLVNVTIDDRFGDERTGLLPDYQPSDSWVPVNESSRPAVQGADWTRVQNRTWEGSAVYVFFVTAGADVAPLEFALDDAVDTQHVSPLPNVAGTPFSYNQLVFKDTSLSHGAHILQITVSEPNRKFGFIPGAIFDYATYTRRKQRTAAGREQLCRNTDDSIAPFPVVPQEGRTAEGSHEKAAVLNKTEAETLDRVDLDALPVQAMEGVMRLRAELEQMRVENELLRRIAEPPPRYSGRQRTAVGPTGSEIRRAGLFPQGRD
ncbi:hypothetical protein AURDEDRAFT_123933 [Auricularia subglabra TFB-10046 SS5]|nr:hypothetical protein AURDEDRAFT_123933 [Auricularia subglabra TFB-10046 SS5]